jgi:hypothetical protein
MHESPSAGGFEIRIKGRVGEPLTAAFPGLHVSVNPVETVLRSDLLDQAGLYAVLERVLSLGLELVEVRKLPPADRPEPQGHGEHGRHP